MAVSSIGNISANGSYSAVNCVKGTEASVFLKQNPEKTDVDTSYCERIPSIIESKLTEIASKSNKFTVEDLIVFFQNTGIELDKLASRPKEDIDRFFAHWEKRILACNNADELNEAANDFKNAKKMGLAGILKKYLPQGVTSLDQVSDTDLEKAIIAFINDNADKLKDTNNAQKMLKIFQRLLDGTKDEDKIRLWNAFKKVAAENKQVAEVLDAIILSIAKSEDVQKFISQIPAETLEVLGLSKDELIASLKVLAENSDVENLQKFKQEIADKINKFQEEHGEAINNIKNKIQEREQEIGRKLTDEEVLELLKDSPDEQKLYQAYITIRALSSGFIAGNANNKIVPDEVKTNNIRELYEKLSEYGYHTDVLSDVKEYFSNHREEFSDSPENFTKILDEATNGEYSSILLPEIQNNAPEKTAQADVGFILSAEPERKNLEEKKAVVNNSVEKTGHTFTVEPSSPKSVREIIKENGLINVVNSIEDYGTYFSQNVAKMITETCDKTRQLYYANQSSSAEFQDLIIKFGDWSSEQIGKLQASIARKKVLEKNTEQKQN